MPSPGSVDPGDFSLVPSNKDGHNRLSQHKFR